MKRRLRMSSEEWKQIISRYELSGQTRDEFCVKHNLGRGSFKHWYYRFRKNSESNILPVHIAPPSSFSLIGLTLPNGSRLEFDKNLPAAYAADLIREINRC